MSNELPPQAAFDALSVLFNSLVGNIIKLPAGESEYRSTLFSICGKAIKHIEVALKLLAMGNVGEAIIILRSAYEATTLFLYLIEHEREFDKYKAYSALVNLRNKIEAFEIAGSEMSQADKEGYKRVEIDETRSNIIENKYHEALKLTLDDLNNFGKLKKETKKAHFVGFEKMREALMSVAHTKGLKEMGFETYNLGSQLTHSHFEMVIRFYRHNIGHPFYGASMACRQSAYLLIYLSKGLERMALLKPEFVRTELFPAFMQVLNQLDAK